MVPRALRLFPLAAWALASGCLTTSDVSRADARRLVDGGAVLLDVRSPAEFAERHPPEAVNIPLEQLRGRLAELRARHRPIVVYCHTGVRAAIARKWLVEAGLTETRNLGTLGHWYVEPSATPPTFQ